MKSIIFKCPQCQAHAAISLTDDEAESMRERIINEGRSPTMIVRCEEGHELLVTLYNLRDGSGLGVRDVVVPVRSGDEETSGSEEVDWVKKAFGG